MFNNICHLLLLPQVIAIIFNLLSCHSSIEEPTDESLLVDSSGVVDYSTYPKIAHVAL